MRSFVSALNCPPLHVDAEHGGAGPLIFRRLLASDEFATNVDFVDYTIIPSGTTIGRHLHDGNEEIYYIAAGRPLLIVNGEKRRLRRNDVTVVRSGEWHELHNDTQSDVEIVVVQVHL